MSAYLDKDSRHLPDPGDSASHIPASMLVASSDPATREMWAILLEPVIPEEWKVIGTACSLGETLSQIRVLRPRLLIVHSDLLGADPRGALRLLSRSPVDLRVVVVKSASLPMRHEDFLQHGASSVVSEERLVHEIVPQLRKVLAQLDAPRSPSAVPEETSDRPSCAPVARRDSVMTILIADDNEQDCLLASEAVRRAHLRNDVRFVRDGMELLDYLRGTGNYADPESAPRPGLIFLDLNMPRMDGRQALEQIKADPNLARIPVVILTSSRADEDYWRAQRLAADHYLIKPVTLDALVHVVRSLGKYEIQIVEMPERKGMRPAVPATPP